MSRIGKKPVTIPSGVEVKIEEGSIMVKGPKGQLVKPLHPSVTVSIENNEATVSPANETKLAQSLWGTFASHIANMVVGVTEGFQKQLIIEGVGYRAETQGKNLVLQLGFSHPIELTIPEDLEVAVEKNTLTISGIDKEKIGQFAADIREYRKPEPYKGKGIRYSDEVIRRKEGKKSA